MQLLHLPQHGAQVELGLEVREPQPDLLSLPQVLPHNRLDVFVLHLDHDFRAIAQRRAVHLCSRALQT